MEEVGDRFGIVDEGFDRPIEVGERLGSRDLSLGVAGLDDKIPTTENLAVLVYDRLAAALMGTMAVERVRVYESADLYVEYAGRRQP